MPSYFAQKDIILFLNKSDLFRDKLQKADIRQPEVGLFEDYDGGRMEDAEDDATYEKGLMYMQGLFERALDDPARVRGQGGVGFGVGGKSEAGRVRRSHLPPPPTSPYQVTVHVTCATDTDVMTKVLDSTKSIILKQVITNSVYM